MESEIGQVLLSDMLFLLKGMVVGFAVAIPLGPASVVCLRRTLHGGFWMGMASGLGVALGDTFYGSLAALGLTSVADFMVTWFNKLGLYAGLLLIVLGIYLFRLQGKPHAAVEQQMGYVRAVLSTCGMTLANPFVLVIFTAVLTAVGAAQARHAPDLVIALIFGIFLGAMIWWLLLCGAMALLHQRIRLNSLAWTNKFAGALIILFGVLACASRLFP